MLAKAVDINMNSFCLYVLALLNANILSRVDPSHYTISGIGSLKAGGSIIVGWKNNSIRNGSLPHKCLFFDQIISKLEPESKILTLHFLHPLLQLYLRCKLRPCAICLAMQLPEKKYKQTLLSALILQQW